MLNNRFATRDLYHPTLLSRTISAFGDVGTMIHLRPVTVEARKSKTEIVQKNVRAKSR